MKKYIAFIASFILFYAVFQIVSGLILTSFYTPTFSPVASAHAIEFGEASAWPFLLTIIAASIAFFVSTNVQKG